MKNFRTNYFLILITIGILSCQEEPEAQSARMFITVGPNPATSQAVIYVSNPTAAIYTVKVYDVDGSRKFEAQVPNGSHEYAINIEDSPKGKLNVILNTPNGIVRIELLKI